MGIYLIFQELILNAFGARVNEETFRLSKEYFLWIALGFLFYMFGQAVNPIIRSDRSPRFAMVTLVIGAVLNIIFDPVCIYILHWGMAGAAIATIAGQIVSAVLAAAYLFRMKAIKLNKDCFFFRPKLMREILVLGGASFLSQIPTAVIGIVMKFFRIIISISAGLAAGSIPIAGYNVGAGRNDRVIKVMKRLMTTEALVGLTATLIFLAFPHTLIQFFGVENASIYYTQFGIWYIRSQLCLLPLACMNKGTFIFL